jgi:prevent-host-death family protein
MMYVMMYVSLGGPMTTLTATQARTQIFKLLDETAASHQPIQITGRRNNGVLLSEEDFRAMQETLYLVGVPGMKASLLKAKKAPLKAYSKKRPW